MEPIRVLHILHSMNRGGAENALMNYYRFIDRSKIQFDFLLTESDKCPFEDEILSLGGRIYRVPLLSIFDPLPYLKGVKVFFQSHPEYRIVHSHTSSKSFFPLFIAKLSGISVRISHSHSSKAERGINGVIRKALRPFLRLVATDWLSCGVSAGRYLYGLTNEHKVIYFRNVIEAKRFIFSPTIRNDIRQKLKISNDTFVFGHIARFDPVKNHMFGVDILFELKKICPNVKLLEVGLGVEEGISDYAKQKGVYNDIIFTGVVDNVWDYEQAIDAFILPSFNEGLPLSIIEAQVAGLPCFTTEGGVTKECSVTNLVTYLPLELGAEEWATRIYDSRNIIRKSYLKDIISQGYDAETSANLLQDFYIDRYNENC